MKNRLIAFLLLMLICFVCPFTVFAEGEEAPAQTGMTFELPTPVIDTAVLDKDDEGYTIIVVTGKPHEELAAIDQYLADNNSYAIGVEFNVNINNEGFVKVESRGEKAADGFYSFDLPAAFSGKFYKSKDSYFQIQMRYVYDYDWIRIQQSEWSNTLEINPELSQIDMTKKAETAALTTTLLWIGGGVVLAALLVLMCMGGDTRCPECRARVSKKDKTCSKCGHDMRAKSAKKADAAAKQ